jgi:CheY-like chemotaxis protein
MLSGRLLQDYLSGSAELLQLFRDQPTLFMALKRYPELMGFSGQKRPEIVELLIRDPSLHEALRRNQKLIPLLRDSEAIQNLAQVVPEVGNFLTKNSQLLETNTALRDLLFGRPSFVCRAFRPAPTGRRGGDDRALALYESLVAKVAEFRERAEKGNRLPTFAITLNSKSLLEEVDVALSESRSITTGDSLRSLEGVLAEAFLSYSGDPIREGYLSDRFSYRARDGDREKEATISGMDLLFNPLTMLSQPVFVYVLWLLSGRVDLEVGRMLASVCSLLEGMQRSRPRTAVAGAGHVLLLEPAAGDAEGLSLDEFLVDLGVKIEQVFAGQAAGAEPAARATYLRDLHADQDVHFDHLREALRRNDYPECDRVLRRCTSESYLGHKGLVDKFLAQLRRTAAGDLRHWQLYADRGRVEFLAREQTASCAAAVDSLIGALCKAANVPAAAGRFADSFGEDEHRAAVADFCRTHERLRPHRTFQMHQDFLAAARELPGFDASCERAFFERHHPLSDLLRPLLQRRYEELPVVLAALASDDYRILSRQLRDVHASLSRLAGAHQAGAALPDPLIEQGEGWPRLAFGEAAVHRLDVFAQCLALQLVGILTGETAANEPSLWLRDVLATHSAIDNFLAALWGRTFHSLDGAVTVLAEIRENLLEHLIQHRHQGRPERSRLREARIKLATRPTRDLSVLRRENTTVLVVDDMQDIVESTKTLLELHGCTVLTAYHGREGLERFRQNRERIDIILSDVRMPGMDGLEMTREIKQTAPEVPVVLVSGMYEPAWTDVGAAACLSKPVSFEKLLATFLQALADRYPERYAETGI